MCQLETWIPVLKVCVKLILGLCTVSRISAKSILHIGDRLVRIGSKKSKNLITMCAIRNPQGPLNPAGAWRGASERGAWGFSKTPKTNLVEYSEGQREMASEGIMISVMVAATGGVLRQWMALCQPLGEGPTSGSGRLHPLMSSPASGQNFVSGV